MSTQSHYVGGIRQARDEQGVGCWRAKGKSGLQTMMQKTRPAERGKSKRGLVKGRLGQVSDFTSTLRITYQSLSKQTRTIDDKIKWCITTGHFPTPRLHVIMQMRASVTFLWLHAPHVGGTCHISPTLSIPTLPSTPAALHRFYIIMFNGSISKGPAAVHAEENLPGKADRLVGW